LSTTPRLFFLWVPLFFLHRCLFFTWLPAHLFSSCASYCASFSSVSRLAAHTLQTPMKESPPYLGDLCFLFSPQEFLDFSAPPLGLESCFSFFFSSIFHLHALCTYGFSCAFTTFFPSPFFPFSRCPHACLCNCYFTFPLSFLTFSPSRLPRA